MDDYSSKELNEFEEMPILLGQPSSSAYRNIRLSQRKSSTDESVLESQAENISLESENILKVSFGSPDRFKEAASLSVMISHSFYNLLSERSKKLGKTKEELFQEILDWAVNNPFLV